MGEEKQHRSIIKFKGKYKCTSTSNFSSFSIQGLVGKYCVNFGLDTE